MGSSLRGRLGLSDREISAMIKQPTQITIGLPKPSFQSKIIHVESGVSHSIAVTRAGDIYSWGEGSMQRLGLGYIEETKSTPDQQTPYQVHNVFDSRSVVSISCGKTQTGVAMQSGNVFMWGKGAHEKPRQDDYMQCSTPYSFIEQK